MALPTVGRIPKSRAGGRRGETKYTWVQDDLKYIYKHKLYLRGDQEIKLSQAVETSGKASHIGRSIEHRSFWCPAWPKDVLNVVATTRTDDEGIVWVWLKFHTS